MLGGGLRVVGQKGVATGRGVLSLSSFIQGASTFLKKEEYINYCRINFRHRKSELESASSLFSKDIFIVTCNITSERFMFI
jgi:hypothetical protein